MKQAYFYKEHICMLPFSQRATHQDEGWSGVQRKVPEFKQKGGTLQEEVSEKPG